ncbi:MAG: response regulator [Desulfobacterales bacterium]|nr:response regulator [Desulfobacterales bacterium]
MEKYNILIVEDDKNLLIDWKKILEDEGYQVDIAENGKVALDLWENNIYDIILADLRMPEIDGREVVNTIKSRQPNTQIIIISGQGKDDDLIDAINKHVFAYLPKSDIDIDDIIETTAEALKKRDHVLLYLEQMAEKSPDKPILLAGSESYTPRQIYDEVRKGTLFGKQYYDDLKQTLIEVEPLEESVDDILGINGILG